MQKLMDFFKDFFEGLSQRKLTVFASSGCYYMFMSIVPITMIFCCILPYTPISETVVLGYVNKVFTSSLVSIVTNVINAIYDSGQATLTISILLTIFSASASMRALMKGMDAAYGVYRKDNFIIFCIKSLFYMILLVLATILSVVVMVYGEKILIWLMSYLPHFKLTDSLFAIISNLRFVLVMVVLALIFARLYKIMPAGDNSHINHWPGAIFASIAWVVFSWGYSWYISISNQYGAYGIIGTIMVAMLWMFYCLLFLLIGGLLNSKLALFKYNYES